MKRPVVITLLIVALALVCVGIGAVIFFAINNGFATNISFDTPRVSAEAEEIKTLNVEGPVALKVFDESGDVIVTGAEVEKVTVQVVKKGFGTTQARAEEALKNIQYEIEQNGDTITLTYEYPDVRNQIFEQVDFIVTVPVETKVNVDSSIGEVSVEGVQGQVVIDNDFGDITVEKVDGALEVKTNSGRVDVVSVKAGTGNIDLYSGFGTISLGQVSGAGIKVQSNSGKLELENVRATKAMELSSDFGNVEFETGSANSLDVKTQSGAVTITSISVTGELTVKDDFGDINLEQVKAASYDVETNSGSIIVDGVKGQVRAHTGFGNITIKSAEEVTVDLFTQSGSIDFSGTLGEGPHTVHSDFGEIELNIPADSALNVDLQTEFGKIISDIPITVTLSGEIKQDQQAGTMNGGGASLKVDTNSGNITIRASSTK